VVKKDIEKNLVYLAQGYEPEEVYKTEFEVGDIHWITPGLRTKDYGLRVKIRHGEVFHECELKGNQVTLKERVHGVAAGQFAVFYDEDVCLGSAVIA